MFDRIDHVGIAVADLDQAIELWQGQMGLHVSHREVVAEQGVEAVLLDVGENHVELLAPLAPDTAVGRFIAKRGPGLHHVAYQVADIDAALASLKAAGLPLIDERPRTGIRGSRVAFLDPRGTERVLVELVQPAHAAEDRGHAAEDHGHAAEDNGHAAEDRGHAAEDRGHAAEPRARAAATGGT